MILVDTAVWIDHLRHGDELLSQLLIQEHVLMHPMILGELACGHLKNREELLKLWSRLPKATEATHKETMYCIEQNQLMGKGIGYVDANLLASTMLSSNALLWTRDKRLHRLASHLNIAFLLAD
jgi:predicted nucleic acid-binding protein